MSSLNKLAVFDDIYCDARINVSDCIKIHVNKLVDLEDILSSHLLAFCVLDECNLTVK